MTTRQQTFFWIALAALIFAFFRWLFGIAIPEIALEFSIGITVVLTSGLVSGRAATKAALKTNTLKNLGKALLLISCLVIVAFVFIAFLLNAMIANTTFLPFAVTVLLVFLVAAGVGAVVSIVRHQNKLKVQSAQAAMAQSESELQLLQSRLSPHFLFNTLNNLYGLSLNDPQKVPPLLLKLSELLRYSVYDAKDIFVPLQYEVDYIKNYIEFEKLRLGDRLRLKLDMVSRIDPTCKVPPLLLVVFVENAFKHSRNTPDEKIWIDISLGRKENSIVFSVRNSWAAETIGASSKGNSGFGLDSVQKRLDLLYAGKHDLKIDRTNNEYTVNLILECQ
jgi:sensor histidine kinase YesM